MKKHLIVNKKDTNSFKLNVIEHMKLILQS